MFLLNKGFPLSSCQTSCSFSETDCKPGFGSGCAVGEHEPGGWLARWVAEPVHVWGGPRPRLNPPRSPGGSVWREFSKLGVSTIQPEQLRDTADFVHLNADRLLSVVHSPEVCGPDRGPSPPAAARHWPACRVARVLSSSAMFYASSLGPVDSWVYTAFATRINENF